MSDITGCIIRVKHNDEGVCRALADEFGGEYDVSVMEVTHASGPVIGHMFRMERMGNLDLEGWLSSFASDLEDMRTDGVLPNFGDSLTVNIELVY
jgi:hypothetical protein